MYDRIMKPEEKIIRATYASIETIKDAIEKNVVSAVKSGKVNVDDKSMSELLQIVKLSIDDGYQRSHNVVMRSIEHVFNEELKSCLGKVKK